jgi:hypothetical protein
MRLPDNPAVAELSKLKPAKLRVFCAGDPDNGKAVAIPSNRKKWETLAHTLDGLDWLRIEALDARGNIVGVVAREEEPDDEDEPGVDYDAAEAARDERMLALMLKAQSVALAAQERSQRPLIDGMAKLVGTVTTALDATSRAYNAALAAASSMPAAAGGENDESASRFMQMVMMLAMRSGQPGLANAAGVVQDAARVAAAKPAATPPSKPNGAPRPSTPPAPGH